MKRIVILIGLAAAALLAFAAPASASTHHHTLVLGVKGLYAPYGRGWGTAHPNEICAGGPPSSDVYAIRWSHSGRASSYGHGQGMYYKPQGGYYNKPVNVLLTATNLGSCPFGGPRHAYRSLYVKRQLKPGSHRYSRWGRWGYTLCHD